MTPPSYSVAGPARGRCPFVRESCSLCLRRKIREVVVMEPARRPGLTGTPVREGGCLGVPGQTRSARSGGCRVSREVGLPAALPYERRQLPTRVDGPCRARPREFVGLPPLRVRPVRGPGFTPPSRCHLSPRTCKIKIWHSELVKLCHLDP